MKSRMRWTVVLLRGGNTHTLGILDAVYTQIDSYPDFVDEDEGFRCVRPLVRHLPGWRMWRPLYGGSISEGHPYAIASGESQDVPPSYQDDDLGVRCTQRSWT